MGESSGAGRSEGSRGVPRRSLGVLGGGLRGAGCDLGWRSGVSSPAGKAGRGEGSREGVWGSREGFWVGQGGLWGGAVGSHLQQPQQVGVGGAGGSLLAPRQQRPLQGEASPQFVGVGASRAPPVGQRRLQRHQVPEVNPERRHPEPPGAPRAPQQRPVPPVVPPRAHGLGQLCPQLGGHRGGDVGVQGGHRRVQRTQGQRGDTRTGGDTGRTF